MSIKKAPPVKIKFVRAYYVADKDRDPVMARLGEVAAKDGRKRSAIAKNAGVAPGTLSCWWDKKAKRRTRFPKFATVVSAARALGPDGEKALFNCIRQDGKLKK